MLFTVKRSEWYRGKGSAESKLLREDDLKCCIGFVCLQLGLSEKQIINKGDIMSMVASSVEPWGDKRLLTDNNLFDFGNHPKWLEAAYRANDTDRLTDAEREEKLKSLFKQGGHEIEFVD
jgi:hypothetical protein